MTDKLVINSMCQQRLKSSARLRKSQQARYGDKLSNITTLFGACANVTIKLRKTSNYIL